VPSKIVIVPGGGHGSGVQELPYLTMMADFFKENLKTTSAAIGEMNSSIRFSVTPNHLNSIETLTTISFILSEKAIVNLNVFDTLGHEISNIISGEKLPCYYIQQWNAEGLPNGVYLFNLSVGNYAETKKLILSK
jgi:hypothetical protein